MPADTAALPAPAPASTASWPSPWAWVLRAAGLVFSFECALLLMLFAGIYKADPRFAWLPVDPTALFFGLSVIAGIHVALRRGLRARQAALALVWLAAAFAGWALLSLLWTPGHIYAYSKALYTATLLLWPLAGCALIIAPEPARYRRFFLLLLLLSVWVAAETAVAFAANAAAGHLTFFVNALSGTYLSLGRAIGPGLIVLLTFGLYIERRLWLRLPLLGLAALFLLLLLSIGGRGPFIAALLAALAVIMLGLRFSLGHSAPRLLVQYLLVLLVAGVLLAAAARAPQLGISEMPATLRRLALLSEMGLTRNSRIEHFRNTWNGLDAGTPAGYGVGSWPVVLGYGDFRGYPHNIFLEILFELGLPGLLLFVAMLWVALRGSFPLSLLRGRPYALLALGLFLGAFLNAQVSGDLNDNRWLFACLGLLMLTGGGLGAGEPAQSQPNEPAAALVGSRDRGQRES